MMEFEAGGEWFDGEFLKMELDSDGDELCHIRDPETKEVHRILLREANGGGEWVECLDWYPLWLCDECREHTRGKYACEICSNKKEHACGD